MTLGLGLVLALSPAVVSVQTGSGTAAEVLARVSAASGVAMRTDGPVGQERLVVSVSEADVDGLRERVAWALHASWRLEEGVWVLRRTAEDERRARTAWNTARLATEGVTVGAGYAGFEEEDFERALGALRGTNEDSVMMGAVGEVTTLLPMGRLGRALAGTLAGTVLAEMEVGDRVVVREMPNRAQLRFGSQEQEFWRLARLDQERLTARATAAGLRQRVGFVPERGAFVGLTLQRLLFGMGLDVTEEMRLRLQSGETLTGISRTPVRQNSGRFAPLPVPDVRFAGEVALPPVFAGVREGQHDREALRRWWMNDAEAGVAAFEAAFAEAFAVDGQDVVIAPPALLMQMAVQAEEDGRVRFPKVFEALSGSLIEFRTDGGFVGARPPSRADEAALQGDRRALRRFLDAGAGWSDRDLARFALDSGVSPWNAAAYPLFSIWQAEDARTVLQDPIWFGLRALGTLSETEWRTLMERGELALVNLSGRQRRELERWVYGSPLAFAVEEPEDGGGTRVRLTTMVEMGPEPTDVFPEGLPAGVLRRVTETKPQFRVGYALGSRVTTMIEDARNVASMMQQGANAQVAWVEPVTVTTQQYQVRFGAYGREVTIPRVELMRGAGRYPLMEIPEEFRKEIDAERARLEEWRQRQQERQRQAPP